MAGREKSEALPEGRVSVETGGSIWPAKPMVESLRCVKSDYKSDYFRLVISEQISIREGLR